MDAGSHKLGDSNDENLGVKTATVVVDVVCDVCCRSTQAESGGFHYGELRAAWGYGSAHDGDRYEVHLCERCFFQALATMKRQRQVETMFDGNDDNRCPDNFGLKATGDF